MKYFHRIIFTFLILASFASCKSAVYEWDDGSWERKAEGQTEETVTVIIHIQ